MAVIAETRIGRHGGGVVRIMDDCCRGLTAEEAAKRHEAARREIIRALAEAAKREEEDRWS